MKQEIENSFAELGRYFTPSQTMEGTKRALALGAVGLGMAGVFYIRHFNPSTQGIFPRCPFNLLTGLHCPGCGITRAFHQLFNGNIIGALDYNIMILFWVPFLSYLGVSLLLIGIRGRGLPRFIPPNFLITFFVVFLMVFWVVRNLPFYPFTVLAP
jgi:hypothetical protein